VQPAGSAAAAAACSGAAGPPRAWNSGCSSSCREAGPGGGGGEGGGGGGGGGGEGGLAGAPAGGAAWAVAAAVGAGAGGGGGPGDGGGGGGGGGQRGQRLHERWQLLPIQASPHLSHAACWWQSAEPNFKQNQKARRLQLCTLMSESVGGARAIPGNTTAADRQPQPAGCQSALSICKKGHPPAGRRCSDRQAARRRTRTDRGRRSDRRSGSTGLGRPSRWQNCMDIRGTSGTGHDCAGELV
jgi:hypothetical protein